MDQTPVLTYFCRVPWELKNVIDKMKDWGEQVKKSKDNYAKTMAELMEVMSQPRPLLRGGARSRIYIWSNLRTNEEYIDFKRTVACLACDRDTTVMEHMKPAKVTSAKMFDDAFPVCNNYCFRRWWRSVVTNVCLPRALNRSDFCFDSQYNAYLASLNQNSD